MSRTDLEREKGLWTQAMLSSRIAAALDRKATGVRAEEDDQALMSKASGVLHSVFEGTKALLNESAAAPSGEVVSIMPSAFRVILSTVESLGKAEPKPEDLIGFLKSVSRAFESEEATREDYSQAELFFDGLSSALSSRLSPHPRTPVLQ